MNFQPCGGARHEVGGVYREVVPDTRLVFTWAWHSTPERESLVAVTIAAGGGGGRAPPRARAGAGPGGRPRQRAHSAPRAVLRSEGPRRPRARLDRYARQAGAAVPVSSGGRTLAPPRHLLCNGGGEGGGRGVHRANP